MNTSAAFFVIRVVCTIHRALHSERHEEPAAGETQRLDLVPRCSALTRNKFKMFCFPACPHIPTCSPCFEEFEPKEGDRCCPNQGKCVKLPPPECAEGETAPDARGKCPACFKAIQRPLSSNPGCEKTFTCCARRKRGPGDESGG